MIGRTLNMAGLKEFLEKLEGDTGLQEKVKAAVDENALLKVITDAGYDVKPEELKTFAEAVVKEGALSDDDLDSVAGGRSIPPCPTLGSSIQELLLKHQELLEKHPELQERLRN
jgi:predicted ribosomally synthesized peptide with nif11-like leader